MGLYWKNIEKEVRYYNYAAVVISIEIYQLFNKIFGVSVGNEVKGCRCVVVSLRRFQGAMSLAIAVS